MNRTPRKQKNSQKDKAFLADGTCGDIARLLRSAGYDVKYASSPNPQLIALALKEDRLLLTRSETLSERGKDTVLLLPEDLTAAVTLLCERELIRLQEPFSRCLSCNQELLFIPKKDVRHLVPTLCLRLPQPVPGLPGMPKGLLERNSLGKDDHSPE